MSVFLTGGTGFIGQALVRALRVRGLEVAVLVRDPATPAARWLAQQGCTLVAGDVTRADGLAAAMRGAALVIHNAGLYEIGAGAALRARMRQVNERGTDHVLGAAHAAGVPRTLYVSTVWALGATGVEAADESHVHGGRFLTAYEASKHAAHQVALRWRARGLPLVIAMPNAVIGPNDHSVFGHFLRLYLMHAMPPLAFGADTIYGFVDVDALADGLCRAGGQAAPGQDYVFSGPPQTLRQMFAHWARHPGGSRRLLWLPRGLMLPAMALMEPLLRAAGVSAFMSRDAVRATRGHLNYRSDKAARELGWQHPEPGPAWDRIVRAEAALLAIRTGWRDRLRPMPVLP